MRLSSHPHGDSRHRASSPCAGLAATTGTAQAAPSWAPADTAQIHPGTMMYTDGAQCTANFVYTDCAGNVYVGYAAHCAGKGEATDTNGCDADSVPLGTKVTFTNDGNLASEGTTVGTGTLAYSSWITENQLGTTDANTCAYNDLALVKVRRRRRLQGEPLGPVLGRPDRHRHRRHQGRRPRVDLRQLQPPRRRRTAVAAHRHQPR